MVASLLIAALSGFLVWTFVEYAMHNFNGHQMKGRTHFSRDHLKHHAEEGYFAPTSAKILRASVIMPIIYLLTLAFIPWQPALAFSGAFLAGHVLYEVVHYRLHFYAPQNAYMRWAARHHFAHHFNCPNHNHGVTTSLWDHVFGTYRAIEEVRVPRRRAMVWLVDQQTDDVILPFQDTFRLTGRARRA